MAIRSMFGIVLFSRQLKKNFAEAIEMICCVNAGRCTWLAKIDIQEIFSLIWRIILNYNIQ